MVERKCQFRFMVWADSVCGNRTLTDAKIDISLNCSTVEGYRCPVAGRVLLIILWEWGSRWLFRDEAGMPVPYGPRPFGLGRASGIQHLGECLMDPNSGGETPVLPC